MTEREIENAVMRKMDRLDILFLKGAIGKFTYENEVKAIDRWAKEQYAKIRRVS